MARFVSAKRLLLAVALTAACGRPAEVPAPAGHSIGGGLAAAPPPSPLPAAASYEDWYPADITPPEGTSYPCALTALPRDLPGIPPADRAYVNHVYTLLLRATQAKLVLLAAMEKGTGVPAALERYGMKTTPLLDRLRREPVPAGLDAFHRDVVAAVELQRAFFARTAPGRSAGRTMEEVYQAPEGRQASARLQAAWAGMQGRYPAWSEATRDSIYHHLCALDLF